MSYTIPSRYSGQGFTRTKRTSARSTVGIAMMLALTVAACGGGDDEAATSTTAEVAVLATTAVPAVTSTTIVPQTTYEVKNGDVLGTIAETFGVSMQAILDANGLDDPNKLRVGQTLVIPRVAPPTAPPSIVTSTTAG